MRFSFALIAAACAVALGAPAGAQHPGDIFLSIIDGRLATGRVLPDQSIDPDTCLFAATFGDSGCGPFTANPGFDALPGTFTVGTKLGWNALDAWKAWDGAGFEPSGGEHLDVSFSSLSFQVQDDPVAGFDLFVQPNGGFHVHLDFCMDGCPNICMPTGADPGIYLLALEMDSTDAAVAPSDPFWIVFNYLDTTEHHADALAWVQANLCATEACPADIDGNGTVNVDDLVAVIIAWGATGDAAEDVNGDLVVNVNDLVEVVIAWGDCV